MANINIGNKLIATNNQIANIIRANASPEFRDKIPELGKNDTIVKIGDSIVGNVGFRNEFLNALMNRIGQVRIKTATFENQFAVLKKGDLPYGSSVLDVYSEVISARVYNPETAWRDELKRNLPDLESRLHVMNFQVMYPITISHQQLKTAFLSETGITDLIDKVISSVYVASNYDEMLLFKYLLIEGVNSGKIVKNSIPDSDEEFAIATRKISNDMVNSLPDEYNGAGVKRDTPKSRQFIIMDNTTHARIDVKVLANAFNMEKAEVAGKIVLVDSFEKFDNERFSELIANDQISPVSQKMLENMKKVKAILVDEEFFQVYDTLNEMQSNTVSSGLYNNYFYHVWKIVSSSDLANAVSLTTDTITLPTSIKFKTEIMLIDGKKYVLSLNKSEQDGFEGYFTQTQSLTVAGIAVQSFGTFIIPKEKLAGSVLIYRIGKQNYKFTATNEAAITSEITFVKS